MIIKEYHRKTRKPLETKFCSRNRMKGINTWAIYVVIYSGSFLNWTKEELRNMDNMASIDKKRKRKRTCEH